MTIYRQARPEERNKYVDLANHLDLTLKNYYQKFTIKVIILTVLQK